MAINQLASNPARQLAAHATGARLTGYLSVVLVVLVMVACATSTLQRQPNQHEQRHLFQSPAASRERHPLPALKRSPPTSDYESFGSVYDRPQTYLNSFAQSSAPKPDSEPDEVQDFETNDDEFLRQLKETARYLDKKLAERQRQQQQLAAFNQATDLGERPLEPAGQQRQSAYGYQGPVYSMIDEQRPAFDQHAQFASGWPILNDLDDSAEPDAGAESDVVVVAPGHGNSQLASGLTNSMSDYNLLDQRLQQLQQQQQQQQQQQSNTDAKYKQLLKSLLIDHVQANSLAGSFSNENQKRDSMLDETDKLVDDRPTTNQQQPQQQQRDDTTGAADAKPAAKLTTLLEDEPDNGQPSSPSSPSLKGDDRGAAATPNEQAPAGVTYGKLVYDQAGQRPSVASNISSTVGSVFGRLYSNVAHYLPFLAQLTNLRQGNDSGANSTTGSGTSKPISTMSEPTKDNKAAVKVAIGNNDEVASGQAVQSADDELHANRNVSVSLALNKSELANQTTTSESGGQTMLENNGEIDHNKQRDNRDDANQDNQQTQTDDKQQQQIRNVQVTLDRKKTIDDEVSNNDDQDQDQDFTGQFANGDSVRPIAAVADTTNKRQQQQQQASKSGGSKRDQTQRFMVEDGDNKHYYNNPVELDMDMSQMAPTSIGQRGFKRDDDDVDDDDNNNNNAAYDQNHDNRYSMMKQSSLMVPIGSASDVLVRTTAGGLNKEPDSLLGKYIYAPTQHYYLNSMMPPAGASHHMLASNGRHIQAGHELYNSYGPDMPMKGAYVYQKDHSSIGDKSNDLYFLVMVGAFCVMAMTVVLAAGLFAYRIQQNRKSSQDTGYPTYGVVGPNNMSAKCGAASFVGGYFTGPPSGSSKSGSVKHLPDLYGTPNGAGGSDSGLNSLDKSSSNKKASSVSSLNEHHQSASSRAASSNFMTAASQDAARMYHYQHQKQQMIISDRNSGGRQTSASDLDSEDENDDGSYTVYECPGLASAHEMEIKNPLFNDDQSP